MMENAKEEKEETTGQKEGRTKINCLQIVRTNLLVILTLVGVCVGFAIGFGIRPYHPSKSVLMWLGLLGEVYLRILKMMIVPLVVCSVIAGTASLDPKSNGRISAVCLGYIMVTNFLPTIIGTILCVIIKPGEGVGSEIDPDKLRADIMDTEDIFADLIRNIFPENLITACFQQTQTQLKPLPCNCAGSAADNTTGKNATERVKELREKFVGSVWSTNILGLIVASTIFGVATSTLKEDGKPFLNFFKSATEIIIKILRVLIWSTPVGSASLVARTIAGTEKIEETFRKLAMYFLTANIGFAVWGLIVIPVTYYVIKRRNPFRFYGSGIHPIMITFATSSTVIALPDTLHTLEDLNGVDKRVSRFVAPMSATLGRAGSSMYICVSCIFIIQLVDMEVNAGRAILVIILTAMSTLAIPSVTGASLVTVLILLTALNIPEEAATMLFALEWLLDRTRSVVNICTQMTGAVFTDKLCQGRLPSMEPVPDRSSVVLEVKDADDNEIVNNTERTTKI